MANYSCRINLRHRIISAAINKPVDNVNNGRAPSFDKGELIYTLNSNKSIKIIFLAIFS